MKTVLVVDDSLFMRTVIRDILAPRYAVVEADSGASCLDRFRRVKPDLVLLDVVMPEGSEEGLRVLRLIRSEDREARVVMITALGEHDWVVRECRALGAKAFVAKPFDERQVLRTVEEAIGP